MVFMFFVAGKPRGKFDNDQIQQMQAAHLANLRARHRDGVLKLAGPCADPDQKKRGIVLLDVKDAQGIEKHFVEDPFVEHGLLTIEAVPVSAPILDLGEPEETGIEEHTIVLFRARDRALKAKPSEAYYAQLPASERPAVALVATKPGTLRMALIFREKDVERIRKLVALDPAVARGALTAEVWQQWLPAGSLANPK